MLLARTDPSAPRHRGLSFLLVDMKTPGVTVKPLRQMTGEADFNETFFDNVAVPRTNLLGGFNEGWRVAMTTLASERGAGGVAAGARFFAAFTAIAELCRHTARCGRPVTEDPLVRQQLAQFYVDVRELRCTGYRVASMLRQGTISGAVSSVIKLTWSELNQRMQSFVMELLGPSSQLMRDPLTRSRTDAGSMNFYARAPTRSKPGPPRSSVGFWPNVSSACPGDIELNHFFSRGRRISADPLPITMRSWFFISTSTQMIPCRRSGCRSTRLIRAVR